MKSVWGISMKVCTDFQVIELPNDSKMFLQYQQQIHICILPHTFCKNVIWSTKVKCKAKKNKKQTECSEIFRVAEPATDPLTFYLVPPAGWPSLIPLDSYLQITTWTWNHMSQWFKSWFKTKKKERKGFELYSHRRPFIPPCWNWALLVGVAYVTDRCGQTHV